MKKQTMRKALFAAPLVAAAAILFAACAPKQGEEKADAIKIAYPNWAEGIAMTHFVANVIEENFGREVELTMADPGLVYASLAEGSEDFMMDAWLPVTHESYMKQYGDRLEVVGVSFESAKIGLVVPAYVDIKSIEELNARSDEFKGQIIGIGQGAGIMKCASKALEEYSMSDIELIPSSGPAMTTALGEAILKHEPVVVTGWEPHWMFARFRLKFLQDPKGVFGAEEEIKTVARKGFSADNPEVAAFLSRIKMDSETLGSLMDCLRETKNDADKKTAVKAWITEHKDLVNSWVKGQ